MTPLALVRAHLNLEPDPADDALLTHYLDAAEAWVSGYIGTPFAASPLATQAVLMLAAHQFENREAVTFGNPYSLPFGIHDLLSPLKARVTGHEVQP